MAYDFTPDTTPKYEFTPDLMQGSVMNGPATPMGQVQAGLRGAAQSVSLDTSPYIEAALRGHVPGTPEYNKALATAKEQNRQATKQWPITNIAANTIGSIAPALGGESIVARAAPNLGVLGRSAAVGAEMGGIQGAAGSENLHDVAYNAALGSGIGLVGGVATNLLGKAVKAIPGIVSDVLPGKSHIINNAANAAQDIYQTATDKSIQKLTHLKDTKGIADKSPLEFTPSESAAVEQNRLTQVNSQLLKKNLPGLSPDINAPTELDIQRHIIEHQTPQFASNPSRQAVEGLGLGTLGYIADTHLGGGGATGAMLGALGGPMAIKKGAMSYVTQPIANYEQRLANKAMMQQQGQDVYRTTGPVVPYGTASTPYGYGGISAAVGSQLNQPEIGDRLKALSGSL